MFLLRLPEKPPPASAGRSIFALTANVIAVGGRRACRCDIILGRPRHLTSAVTEWMITMTS